MLLGLLLLAGCSSAKPKPQPQPKPSGKPVEGTLSAAHPGFFRLYGYEDPELTYKYGVAAKISNLTDGSLCTRCTLTSSLFDSQGNMIASVDDTFQPIFPGSYWFVSSTLDSQGMVPARGEVTISLVRWGVPPKIAPTRVTASQLKYAPGDSPEDYSEIVGVLNNSSGKQLKQVKGVGALVAQDGTPVGAAGLALGKVQPGRTSFDIDLNMTYTGYASMEVTLMPSQ